MIKFLFVKICNGNIICIGNICSFFYFCFMERDDLFEEVLEIVVVLKLLFVFYYLKDRYNCWCKVKWRRDEDKNK